MDSVSTDNDKEGDHEDLPGGITQIIPTGMEKKLIVIAGVPGSGKTHLREEKYKNFPFVDLSDKYNFMVGHTDWGVALNEALTDVEALFEENDVVVLEGIFKKLSASRAWIIQTAGYNHWGVEIIDLDTTFDLCKRRILDQQTKMLIEKPQDREYIGALAEARLKLLKRYL